MAQSKAVISRRGGRGLYKTTAVALQKSGSKSKPRKLPSYLERAEVESLIQRAPNLKARMCMLLQWRAGLRVSEAINITPADVRLGADTPELLVRQGKGGKDRVVPLQAELNQALATVLSIWPLSSNDPIIGVTRQTANTWIKSALEDCYKIQAITPGKECSTHTLRHSAARYWLLQGVPINIVSKWLGHANLQTTLIYLQLISDPGGFMERVP